jgi:hypothetical protein
MKKGYERGNYDFDTPVPRRAAKRLFGHQIPVDTEDVSRMFLPLCYGKAIDPGVEKLDRAITRCCD